MKTKNFSPIIRSLSLSLSLVALAGCSKDKLDDLSNSMALKYESCNPTLKSTSSTATSSRMMSRSASTCTNSQTISSVSNGSWHSASTWGGVVPTACDHVIIKHSVTFADQPGSLGYTHYGDINVPAQGSFVFNEDGPFVMEGLDSNHRSNLVTNANFTVFGDLVLENVHMVADPQGKIRIYKDLVLKENTTINNNTIACNGFVIGDDIILLEGTTQNVRVIHSTHSQVIVGAGPSQTPNTSEQPGTLSQHAGHVFGVAGTAASQIYVVPPRGPYGFTSPATCSALPVNFTSVQGKWDGDRTVVISWTTASEQNSKFFYVEMTQPCSSTMEVVNQGNPIAAAGTSSTLRKYSLSIPVSKGGTYVFRVVEHDIDGSKTYSNYVSVRVGK